MKFENDLREYNIRPVTDKDTWCLRGKNGNNGYIITLPFLRNRRLFEKTISARIVRAKKIGDHILVQLMKHNVSRTYVIYTYRPRFSGTYVLNIKRLDV